MTKKHAHYKWSEKHDKAFQYLKDSLSVVPLLAYPDPNKPYTLYTDASGTCIGACLTQSCEEVADTLPNVNNEKPIYYLSHKLSRTQCKWSKVEKEAYAIHFALQKLDHYLHGAQFVIKTDHKPLKYLLESPMQNKKIQLWALSMAGYNCTIEYIAGTTKKKRQAKYADKGTKQVEFQINDPVYYKNNQTKGKLDCKWKPFYRIIERKGPATYEIKNQLDGSTCKVHAEMLRAANLDEWNIPTTHDGRPMRRTAYAIPPEQSSDEHGSDSEQEGPYEKLAKKYQKRKRRFRR